MINDGAVHGFDTSHPVIDISDDLRPGDNTIRVRVSSSLNNRLLARGYYDQIPDIVLMFVGREGFQQTHPRDYGLLGPVRLLRQV
jgi:hypothetical protein